MYSLARISLALTLVLATLTGAARADIHVRIPAVADDALIAGAEMGTTLTRALATSPDQLAEFRAAIDKTDLAGIVSADLLDEDGRLPFADDLITRLTLDLDALAAASVTISEEEIRRVLAPGGTLTRIRGGKPTTTENPVPPTMDTWTHWDYGAGGNSSSSDQHIAPTTSLRWFASPSTADGGGTKIGMRIVGGRVYYIALDYGLPGSESEMNHLVCRNAFDGTLLWRRDISDVPGRGDSPPRFTLTATADRVLCLLEPGKPLNALDPATGETLFTFKGAAHPPAIGKRDFRNWLSVRFA